MLVWHLGRHGTGGLGAGDDVVHKTQHRFCPKRKKGRKGRAPECMALLSFL